MTLLLDTHTFLWFIEGSVQLSQATRQLIEDEENRRLVSIACLWEMAIKDSIGKLALTMSLPDLVVHHIYGNAMEIYAITPEHLEGVRGLPYHHRDPFDRLLVAQSLTEKIPILTRDPTFDLYDVDRRW